MVLPTLTEIGFFNAIRDTGVVLSQTVIFFSNVLLNKRSVHRSEEEHSGELGISSFWLQEMISIGGQSFDSFPQLISIYL